MTAQPLTAAEQERVARFDAAAPAEESAVERVARALYAEFGGIPNVWEEATSLDREGFRIEARIAIAAMRPAPDTAKADEGTGLTTDEAAEVMVRKADRWYWAEREICGFATDTEPPCVKSPGHDGDCDGTYSASGQERLTAWLDAGGPL